MSFIMLFAYLTDGSFYDAISTVGIEQVDAPTSFHACLLEVSSSNT